MTVNVIARLVLLNCLITTVMAAYETRNNITNHIKSSKLSHQKALATSWFQANSPSNGVWNGFAYDGSGQRILTVSHSSLRGVFQSVDYGSTWTQNSNAVEGNYAAVAVDSTFTYQNAAVFSGKIYYSLNAGASWAMSNAPSAQWISMTSSSSGSDVVAVARTGQIVHSSNYGATYTSATVAALNWYGVTCDSTCLRCAAIAYEGGIYFSSDYASSFTLSSSTITSTWRAISCSSDFQTIAAVDSTDTIYVSRDSGSTWNGVEVGSQSNRFYNVAVNGNGQYINAPGSSGVYSSMDYGATWSLTSSFCSNVLFFASDKSGQYLVCGNQYTYIYACQNGLSFDPSPTRAPSRQPTTIKPTFAPTTKIPSEAPTVKPSLAPTTVKPSVVPTVKPSLLPSVAPTTRTPSQVPTTSPTLSRQPSLAPTVSLQPSSSMPTSGAPSTVPSESLQPMTCVPTSDMSFLPSIASNSSDVNTQSTEKAVFWTTTSGMGVIIGIAIVVALTLIASMYYFICAKANKPANAQKMVKNEDDVYRVGGDDPDVVYRVGGTELVPIEDGYKVGGTENNSMTV